MSVIHLDEFKKKKSEEVSKTRPGRVMSETTSSNFEERMMRIRVSLERINFLMSELKRIKDKETGQV